MEFDIYCDESYPDIFTSSNTDKEFLVIGSLWLPHDKREDFKTNIHSLRDKHKIGNEFKWRKVSPSKVNFYKELLDYFFDQGESLRFRSIVVDRRQVDFKAYHDSDAELGFYKFYYQMLHHWILDYNEYQIFCDLKSNRISTRLETLKRTLNRSNIYSDIKCVQAVRSKESVLLQTVDLLTGAVAAKFNLNDTIKSAKQELICHIENKIGHPIRHTAKAEEKFNVFKINPGGGW